MGSVRDEAICKDPELKLSARDQAREQHRGSHTCSSRVWRHSATSWWVVTVVNPLQALRSSVGVTVMSLVARSNMRWVQRPLWDSLVQLLSSAVYSVYTHTHTHTHTRTGKERQKSQSQNKGIIIPYREKWSSHFPARFRSLI